MLSHKVFFLVACYACLGVSLAARDRRLIILSVLFCFGWQASSFANGSDLMAWLDPAISLTMWATILCLLGRNQEERRAGLKRPTWLWFVIYAETLLLALYPFVSELTRWWVVQIVFAFELLLVFGMGLSRLHWGKQFYDTENDIEPWQYRFITIIRVRLTDWAYRPIGTPQREGAHDQRFDHPSNTTPNGPWAPAGHVPESPR